MKNYIVYLFLGLFLFMTSSCSRGDKSQQALQKRTVVFVTIAPQKGIVESIGGKYVKVRVIVPEGKDPHDYKPAPIQVLALCFAKAYFEIGMPFEKVLLKNLKRLKLKTKFIDMAGNVKRHIAFIDGKKVIDPHLWLSPNNVRILAENALDELIELMPQHRNYFTDNYNQYIKKLEKITKRLKKDSSFILRLDILLQTLGSNRRRLRLKEKNRPPKNC
jgi:ABC-type Zn uptake system ZnuABC Zn-binding protein ZnuA